MLKTKASLYKKKKRDLIIVECRGGLDLMASLNDSKARLKEIGGYVVKRLTSIPRGLGFKSGEDTDLVRASVF